MSVTAAGIEALRAQLEEAVGDPNVAARTQKLRMIRAELERLAGVADTYLADTQLEAESSAMAEGADILAARENADIREELLRRGLATEEQLDARGMLSHEDLDQLAEEGRLEEGIASLTKAFGLALLSGPAFERMVRRGPGGQFRDKPGTTHGRGGGKLKRFDVKPGDGSSGIVRELKGKRGAVKGKRFKVRETIPPKPPERSGSGEHEVLHPAKPAHVPGTKTDDDLLFREGTKAINDEDVRRLRAIRDEKDPEKKAKLQKEHEEWVESLKGIEGRRKFREAGKQARFKKTKEELDKKIEKKVKKAAKKGKLKDGSEKTTDAGPRGTDLSQAETHFNAAGRVSQRTLLSYAEEAAQQPTTVERYRNEDGSYEESRQQLHDRIIDAAMRQRKPDGSLDFGGEELQPPEGDPTVVFTGGGYSSGKGGMVKLLAAEGKMPEDAMVLDPDVIKAELPEFKNAPDDAERNLLVYQEAWDIAQEVQARAQERGLNMVVDGISNTSADEMAARIKSFTDKGYVNPHVAYVSIPTEEAVSRAAKRAEEAKTDADRRMIPEVIMRAVHRDVSATIPALMERAKELGVQIDVYENNRGMDETTGKFRPAEKIAEATPEGHVNVLNKDLFQETLNKAHEAIEGLDAPGEGDAPLPVGEIKRGEVNERLTLGLGKGLEEGLPEADLPDAENPITDTEELIADGPKQLAKLQALLNRGSGLDEKLGAEVFDANTAKGKDAFTQFGDRVRAAEGDDRFVVIGPVKKLERAKAKLRDDPKTRDENNAANLADVTRATVLVTDPADLPEAVKTFTEHIREKGWHVKGIKNRIADHNGSRRDPNNGYGDIMLKLVDEDGFLHEVQFNQASFWREKEMGRGHKLYEEIRQVTEPAEGEGRSLTPEELSKVQPLVEESRKVYNSAWEEALQRSGFYDQEVAAAHA